MCNFFFFFQAEDGIRDYKVTGVQTCALPISANRTHRCPSSFPGPSVSPIGRNKPHKPTANRATNTLDQAWQMPPRSEERRVGKSVDLGGRRIIKKKKKKQQK